MSDLELNNNNNNNNNNVTEENTTICQKAGSVEDLSEYTDADQSISAPTEILAEFLSSIMMKDYAKAQKYCALILYYEPNNLTAKEFYPLIKEKLEMIKREKCQDNSSHSTDCTSNSSSSSLDSDSDDTTASYSSLEDDEADIEDNENIRFTPNDITNGNTSHIEANISSNLNHETKPIGSEEETKVAELRRDVTAQNKTSPSKRTHTSSPIILKNEGFVDLPRTRTNTKSLDNTKPPSNPQLFNKNAKISENMNSKNSINQKISDKAKTSDVFKN